MGYYRVIQYNGEKCDNLLEGGEEKLRNRPKVAMVKMKKQGFFSENHSRVTSVKDSSGGVMK
jgi:hypothetical protein